jgi:hypothetical protein
MISGAWIDTPTPGKFLEIKWSWTTVHKSSWGLKERIDHPFVQGGWIHPKERPMKKISYVLAALATIAIAAPAAAEDKPMMRGGMHEGMHHHMDHRMDMHRHHHHHHTWRHMMRREGM